METENVKGRQRNGVLHFSVGKDKKTEAAAENLLEMMCKPVMSRHLQSLKLWRLA